MTEEKPAKQMPKGGRKGGTRFPRYDLEKCLDWAKKLVSKTHNSAQPRDIIYSGVVGSKSGTGDIKISAMLQFGVMSGTSKAYNSTDLAKKINSAPPEDLIELYREAALKPPVFSGIFVAFQGDAVSKSKLKQRAADLNVHPDETEACVELYISALKTAGLVTVDGDKVIHATDPSVESAQADDSADDTGAEDQPDSSSTEEDEHDAPDERKSGSRNSRANVTVNITVDATLDADKLEKQLRLLKKYGAI